ncbi:MAG TPA: DUF5985 family protein [Candidatus Acidoferrum sp.]|nr:DUF5985 family protein [Candidatus Acidoferrum sp.]
MAALVYLLCAAAALVCAALLWRGYRQSRQRLLFWSSLCFGLLTLDNLFLFADRILLPEVDLAVYRLPTGLAAVGVLLFGMIWRAKT